MWRFRLHSVSLGAFDLRLKRLSWHAADLHLRVLCLTLIASIPVHHTRPHLDAVLVLNNLPISKVSRALHCVLRSVPRYDVVRSLPPYFSLRNERAPQGEFTDQAQDWDQDEATVDGLEFVRGWYSAAVTAAVLITFFLSPILLTYGSG